MVKKDRGVPNINPSKDRIIYSDGTADFVSNPSPALFETVGIRM